MTTFLWSLALAVLVIALIYFEKTDILYILCTLGVTALLMVVAFSDLAHGEQQNQSLAQTDDAAGVASKAK